MNTLTPQSEVLFEKNISFIASQGISRNF